MNKQSELALGRILRMAARPTQSGDMAEYERCRAIIFQDAEESGIRTETKSIGYCKSGWNFGNTTLD